MHKSVFQSSNPDWCATLLVRIMERRILIVACQYRLLVAGKVTAVCSVERRSSMRDVAVRSVAVRRDVEAESLKVRSGEEILSKPEHSVVVGPDVEVGRS